LFHNIGQQSWVGVFDLRKSRFYCINSITPTKRIMDCRKLNVFLNIEGPDYIDDSFLMERENIGNWGVSGWNHTDDAKKTIGEKNRKYKTKEEKLKALNESRKRTRSKPEYKARVKKWKEENKERLKEKQLEYDKKNREKNKKYAKEYYKKNKEYAREYYRKNRDKIRKKAKERYEQSKTK